MISSAFIPLLFSAGNVSANGESWLTGWDYRKSHIVNASSGAGTNYPIQIWVYYGSGTSTGSTAYTSSHCKTDFGDVRFTDDDGSTLLDYWIENKTNGVCARFWVEVADDLSSTAQTIYIYYGEPAATTTSNGNTTFTFFDDFLGSSADADKWNITDTPVVADSTLNCSNKNNDPNPALIYSKSTFSTGLALRTKVINQATTAAGCIGFGTGQRGYTWDAYGSWPTAHQVNALKNGDPAGSFLMDSTGSSVHIFDLERSGTQCKFYTDDQYKGTITGGSSADLYLHAFGDGPWGGITLDWVVIRKYVVSEPVQYTYGTEEEAEAPPATWAPTFTSSPATSASPDESYSYQVLLNETGTVTALNLPSWASMCHNGTSGAWFVNGTTPETSGSYDFHLEGVSTIGTLSAWQNWTVTVGAWASHFDSSPILTSLRNVDYTYEPVTNETATITAEELPEWATFEDDAITGTPDTIGSYDFSLKAIGLGALPVWQNWTVQVSTVGFIEVDGTGFTIDGAPFPLSFRLIGVDETTALTFAVRAYCEGITADWGKNMNFPVPDTGKLNVSSLSGLWHSYFGFLSHYGLNLVRFSNGDSWATAINYQAWLNHETAYYQVLEEMVKQAASYGIFIDLNLAGSAEFPLYDFGAADSVLDLNKNTGHAYHNYLAYVEGIMSYLDSSEYTNAIFSYDVWNEPDHDAVDYVYWQGDQIAFRTWAKVVANDTTTLSEHIVEMGVAGQGELFGWGANPFWNATGGVGFDVCDRHYYASIETDDYLVHTPISWANSCNKPLVWSELAKNSAGLTRWTWFETELAAHGSKVWANMVLRGMEGYPSFGAWAPEFTSSPDTTGFVGSPYAYEPVTNESVTLTLDDSPEWMTLDDGTLGGSPDAAGDFNISLNATSIVGGLSSWQNWTITVDEGTVPSIITTPSGLGAEGDLYEYNALADQTVTWSLSGTAWFLDVNPVTGEVVGIPDTAGVYSVKLVATNEFDLKDWQNWTITVAHTYGDDGGGTNPPPGGNDNSVIFNLSLDMWIVVGVGILILMVAVVSVRRR
jgi:hypothetical protein